MKKTKPADCHIPITMVVVFRNEQNNLGDFLNAIQKINYDALKLIFIDDFSQDLSYKIIEEKILDLPFEALLLRNEKPGKKHAITMALNQCETDYVMTCDADCKLTTGNILAIANELKKGRDMVCGPVLIERNNTFLCELQFYDQLALTSVAVGMGACSMPFMCSAANMAFNKNTFMALQPYVGNLHIHSGDDVFLLEKFVRSKKSIGWLFSKDTLVYTKPVINLKQFIKQRLRWAQKTPVYSNPIAITVSFLVFLFNLILLLGLLIWPVYPVLGYITAKYLLIKLIIDILFLFLASGRLKHKINVFFLLGSFFFHLCYVPPVATASWFVNINWKDRRVRE